MSTFNPKHHDNDERPQDEPMYSKPARAIMWRAIGAENWMKLLALTLLECLIVFAWSGSFATINGMGSDTFLVDVMPLPLALQDLTLSSMINGILGLLAVVTPLILWHFALSTNVLRNPKSYFIGHPLRMIVGVMLMLLYGLIITLEVMSLMTRIDNSLAHSPIPILGEQPDLLPLVIASAALVLGTCLLGLASAALHRSIYSNFSHLQ